MVVSRPELHELVENETDKRPLILDVLTKEAIVEFMLYLAKLGRYKILEAMETEQELTAFEIYTAKYQLFAVKAPALDRSQRKQLIKHCPSFATIARAINEYTAPGSMLVLADLLTAKYKTL